MANVLRKNNKKQVQQNGFTIVELLVAMAVFQVVLVLTLSAYMQITRYFQKTITANRLQQVSNNVVEDIARSIQNTGGLVAGDFLTDIDVGGYITDRTDTKKIIGTGQTMLIGTTNYNVLCVDSIRYIYQFNNVIELGGDPMANLDKHVLMSDTVSSPGVCNTTPYGATSNPRLLFSENTQLYGFGVENIIGTAMYNVYMNVAYTSAPDDVDVSQFNNVSKTGYISCKGGSGRQYCATSNVSTTVVRRIGL